MAQYPFPSTHICCMRFWRQPHLLSALGQTLGPSPASVLPGPILALSLSPNSQASGHNPKIHYEFGSLLIPPYKFLHLGNSVNTTQPPDISLLPLTKSFQDFQNFWENYTAVGSFHFLPHASASLSVTAGGSIILFSFHLIISIPSLSSFPK